MSEIDWSKDDGSEEFAERVVRAAVPNVYRMCERPRFSVWMDYKSRNKWLGSPVTGLAKYADGFMGYDWHSARQHPTVQEWERVNGPSRVDDIDAEDWVAVAKMNPAPTPAPEGERERFEEWWKTQDWRPDHEKPIAWDAWQTRAARAAGAQEVELPSRPERRYCPERNHWYCSYLGMTWYADAAESIIRKQAERIAELEARDGK